MALKVYYGIDKTNAVKRRRAVCVLFENTGPFRTDANGRSYQDRYVERQMHLAYTRQQTPQEAADAATQRQTFTCYTMFVDDRRFNGSLNAVLEFNSQADSRNISEEERLRIAEAIRKVFREVYPEYKEITETEQTRSIWEP